ncbi:hypothetical protein SAMN04489712_103321 [Thermomonospora echinospora]|uniref:Galactokinase n=1 Tax=Thermomonospora echinospora TaxID=1992 RepID=A0A1H5XME5_9ACTN|nr:galactokinase family protein [Thermomonospora echinospora]SEG12921.1 hypothetical protein SAMN04489712_103321 [Thermomonospora echinospora]
MGEAGIAGRLEADPDIRLTAYVFSRVYGDLPQGAWRAPGTLTLLGGPEAALTVALPWGAVVAAAPCADGSELYSLNHHEGPLAPSPGMRPPPWALPCVRALESVPAGAGLRVAVNRLLPDQMGLLSGAETFSAVSLALRDLRGLEPSGADPCSLHGPARALLLRAGSAAEPVPFDLEAAGLRLLLVELGPGGTGPASSEARAGDTVAVAERLRGGDCTALGAMLTQAHRPGNEAADLALEVALGVGALGGRRIGRCVLTLAPVPRIRDIRTAVTTRLEGLTVRPPRFLTAVPSDGAHRVA